MVLLAFKVNAQQLRWYEGAVVLSDGNVMSGNISIEQKHDLILFKTTGNPTVLPAHKFLMVYFYDREVNINRRFVSIKSKEAMNIGDHVYEIVLQGKVSVLRRQRSSVARATDANDYDYYCRFDEKLMPLHKFSRKVYPELVSDHDQRLANFVSENRLKSGTSANLIRIIEYYNHLIVSDESIARY